MPQPSLCAAVFLFSFIVIFVACDLCPDGVTYCPTHNTCCPLDTVQHGCCPFANAVCCPEHRSCCPQGQMCDDTGFDCVAGRFKFPATALLRASQVADLNLTRPQH
uniref:Granulins domain-containing protein n=1 Tax=Plectus sambesii TaxID=2011161 RepID=A0A914VK66_9BILA